MEKKLKPSMRENKRYLLVDEGKEGTERAILDFIGILGYSKAGVAFISDRIVAVNREEVDKVRAALVMAGIRVIRVSGTIRGVKK
jgi:RNase P/RNase MRP subunit POP5